MGLSAEVLIYVQNVKNYFGTNADAHQYFIGTVDEEIFFIHLSEISQKNFEKNGEVMLSKEQFELLRRTLQAIEISTKDIPNDVDENFIQEENIFVDTRGFGKICLN